jgi:hypothetical protein
VDLSQEECLSDKQYKAAKNWIFILATLNEGIDA